MAAARFRVYLDNHPADEALLERFSEVRVDQAIGMASEAELHLPIGTNDEGQWESIAADFAQPFARVRVEVRPADGDYAALIDGPIVGQRFELSGTPNDSKMVLVVHDDSVLLNRSEAVEVFRDRPVTQIVAQLFADQGLIAEVGTIDEVQGSLERVLVRRGSPMQFLRELARRHGAFVYVRPGDSPGQSVGVFRQPDLAPGDLPPLLTLGARRNVNRFTAQFDALRPLTARADSVRATDVRQLTAEVENATLDSLGDRPVHAMLDAGELRLARTREEQDDLTAAADAAVNHSSWAYTAQGEVSADVYAGVMAPHEVIAVAGPGGYLGGHYLIGRVTHVLDDNGYRQQFGLRRNARSDAAGGGSGLIPSGVF